jgi:ABC-2 type transport system ATP-binding protein
VQTTALRVQGLTRSFGQRVAIRDLHLTVQQGDVYGFLGPNGAGKTTALRCILGLIGRDGGTVEIFGEQGRQARRHVGALIETPAFHEWVSGLENLRLAAAYAGLAPGVAEREIARVLDRVGLVERSKDAVGKYSLGMRQRLAIARALLGQPKLLLLDEPTNGLDPSGMREMRELVRSLALHDRITILVSSHLLAEVQAICNRVAILDGGVVKAEGEVSKLLAAQGTPLRIVEVGSSTPDLLKSAIQAMSDVKVEGAGGEGRLRLRLEGIESAVLVRRLVEASVEVDAVIPDRRNLEDVFLEVTTGAPR